MRRTFLRNGLQPEGEVRFSDLTPPWRQLVRLMQKVNFGHISGLHVRGGDPVFDLAWTAAKTVKLRADRDSVVIDRHGGQSLEDFVLKVEVVCLLDKFSEIDNGFIQLIEVRHGLPFSVTHTITEGIEPIAR